MKTTDKVKVGTESKDRHDEHTRIGISEFVIKRNWCKAQMFFYIGESGN